MPGIVFCRDVMVASQIFAFALPDPQELQQLHLPFQVGKRCLQWKIELVVAVYVAILWYIMHLYHLFCICILGEGRYSLRCPGGRPGTHGIPSSSDTRGWRPGTEELGGSGLEVMCVWKYRKKPWDTSKRSPNGKFDYIIIIYIYIFI